MTNHSTTDDLAAGAVSGFFAYVRRSQPQLSKSEVRLEVVQMLRVIGCREDEIAYWVDVVFGEYK